MLTQTQLQLTMTESTRVQKAGRFEVLSHFLFVSSDEKIELELYQQAALYKRSYT
jgi:hypothetical protein